MRHRERGAALLIALGGLALISALTAGAVRMTAAPATRASAAIEQAIANRSAEAAIHRIAAAMTSPENRFIATWDGVPVSLSDGPTELIISAQDVEGLIDLNTAPPDAIRRLLVISGASEQQAADITSIWSEGRSGARTRFGQKEDALNLLTNSQAAAARNALPHATVFSGRSTVDPYSATAPALAARADISLEDAQAFVAARTLNGRRAELPRGADPNSLHVSERLAARVTARAVTENGGRASLSVAMRVTTSPRAPVRFLSWR
ncbi:MAG: hypothetical protein AAF401_15430 [Pseudomonadota bacterium]